MQQMDIPPTISEAPNGKEDFKNHLLPEVIFHKRNRTVSMSERAHKAGQPHKGVIVNFSRTHGHGLIREDNNDEIIEGEYVPLPGDKVTFGKMHIPPKNEKYQAVNVKIIDFTPQHHKRWSEPVQSDKE